MERVVDTPGRPGQRTRDEFSVRSELGRRAERDAYHLAGPAATDLVLEGRARDVARAVALLYRLSSRNREQRGDEKADCGGMQAGHGGHYRRAGVRWIAPRAPSAHAPALFGNCITHVVPYKATDAATRASKRQTLSS
jgi:hypothetical protein